ncbi:glycosyltransferase [Flavimaricola marinus]|uniref:UDP-Glc:alpha-D-GlcNAc-diphosphoundecaprenol beta-1,3-glucosyltransferase WfgD n=1 Tax=Flavimaricola marinus TaxID=1819565 RepID=A0A238LK29_9RHOB|nr:glycosyltransferase [Flavimaricola marinus]SMY09316.1 UDP-Glc:alpha-D-GlcNAc-diphosphoundecaprenol beta-1,3-glucosyltransferase WfgD [Flavimaricola marinus]
MTDSPVPQLDDTDASDRPAQVGRLGHRAITLSHDTNRIGLSQGLDLTWKAPGIPAGPDGVTADVGKADGVDLVRFGLPGNLGWVRLNLTLDRPGTETPMLLAVRALVRIGTADVQTDVPLVQPALSWIKRTTGSAEVIGSTAAKLPLHTPDWHLIEAQLLCAPDSDSHQIGLILQLPDSAQVDLGPLQTAWFDADPATGELARQIAEQPAAPVQPFRISPLAEGPSGEIVGQTLAAPFTATAGLSGTSLTGQVLADAPPEVVLRLGDAEQRLALGHGAGLSVPLSDELCVPYGFNVPLVQLLARANGPLTDVTCHLPADDAGLSAPFARIPLPAAYGGLLTRQPETGTAETAAVSLFHTPPQSGPDPYRKLLYRAMTDTDARPGDLDDAIGRLEASDRPAPPVVLHLHGIAHVLAPAADAVEAELLRRDYVDRLGYFAHLGGIILWTIDSPLPEQTLFEPVWHALGQDIADLARIVHVHSNAARARVTALWQIPPDRMLVAAHPSYLDHYPDYVSRHEARVRLGLEDATGPVFLLQGRLSPDKGIDDLIAAFAILRKSQPDAWLVIMGETAPPLRKGELNRSYGTLPNVRVVETTVADTTLQWYYRAADWAVLPYRDVMTPKALICAMSFGLPVVAPDLGAIPDLVTPGVTGILYPSDTGDHITPLAAAMAEAAALPAPQVQAMGEAATGAITPHSRTVLANALSTAIAQAWPGETVEIAFDDRPREARLMGAAFPPSQPARTAVIILNYGHADDTARLIGTLRDGTDTDFDVYVVDNCSPNLSEFDLVTRFPKAHILRLPENLGYAGGNNAALRLIADLPYQFVWILNPDMVVPPKALSQHIAAAQDHPQTNIFGPALLRGGAAPRLASAGSYISLVDGLSTGHLYAGDLPEVLPKDPFEAEFITGAAVFLRASALAEIGTIPEDYFLYFEETAWLIAAKAKGHRALVLPHIRLAHHKRSEDGDLPAPYFYYYYIRNALIFSGRIGTDADVRATAARLKTDFIATWTARITTSRPDRAAFYDLLARTALADGLAGKTGPVDLIAMELASVGLPDKNSPVPDPDPAELASCTAILTPDGALVGQIALTPETTRAPCTITALLDGRIVGHTRAVRFQPALLRGTAQMHSFEMALPDAARSGSGHRLAFYVNGYPAHRQGAAMQRFVSRPAPALDGGLTELTRHICHGWLVDSSDPDQPLMAEIVHDGQVVGRGRADRPHAGAENGGFAIRLPRAFAEAGPHRLHLRRAGQTASLADAALSDSGLGTRKTAVAPPHAALRALAYGQTLWFGSNDPASQPITRYMQAAGKALRMADDLGSTPLVSVIMPVRNRPGAAVRALRSVQAQRYPMWELILVDDASTDTTLSQLETEIQASNDSRITLLRRATQGGAAAARNTGLARAHGEVIAWLDSDDHWDPDYLSVMTAALLQTRSKDKPGPEAVYCGTWLAQTDPTVPVAEQSADTAQEIIGLRLPPPSLALIENDDVIALSSLVHRRSLIDRLGGFDADLRRYSGWDLVLRASETALPHPVQAALVTRTLGPDSLTETEPEAAALAQINIRTARRGGGAGQTHASPETPPAPARRSDPARPVDVVLRATEASDPEALRRRIETVWLSLRPDAGQRLIVQVGPDMIAALTDLDQQGLLLRQVAGKPNGLNGIKDALACRRPSAALAILEPSTLVQAGWLAALSHAQTKVPQAGMLLTRQVLPGRSGAARRHVPAARPQRDVCITVSADLDNLLDPQLDPADGLMSLTGFDPFCTYIPADVANRLPVPDKGAHSQLDHVTLIREWADFTRLHLNRPLVYCPRAHAFQMPI